MLRLHVEILNFDINIHAFTRDFCCGFPFALKWCMPQFLLLERSNKGKWNSRALNSSSALQWLLWRRQKSTKCSQFKIVRRIVGPFIPGTYNTTCHYDQLLNSYNSLIIVMMTLGYHRHWTCFVKLLKRLLFHFFPQNYFPPGYNECAAQQSSAETQ